MRNLLFLEHRLFFFCNGEDGEGRGGGNQNTPVVDCTRKTINFRSGILNFMNWDFIYSFFNSENKIKYLYISML